MHIKNAVCPECGAVFIVDQKLWDIGDVRLRCRSCKHYFLPEGSPHSMSIEEASNANVPIVVWEPQDAR